MPKRDTHPKVEFVTRLVKQIGGDRGTKLTNAFEDKDEDKFRELMEKLTNNLVRQMKNK